MPIADVPPPVGSGDTPQLFRLGGLKFQALCRDLVDGSEPTTIQQCVEFGVNGEAQYGIDLLANLAPEGIDVVQCKAEQNFTPKKIRDASDEFLKHWDYWKDKGVRRFLVLVGSEVNQRERQEEVAKQKFRFRPFGIDYQLWPASTIVNKLRPYRGIVAQHIDAAWADRICGLGTEASSPLALAAHIALNERLSVVAGSATDERLGRIKRIWQAGHRSEAWTLLNEAKNDVPVWTALPNPVKANVLRFEASISLDSDLPASRVIALINEAAQLSTNSDDGRLRAATLWREGDHVGALAMLDSARTEAELNLKAAMLLSLERVDEAQLVISQPRQGEFTAEHWRVVALCNFASGRVPEARLSIQKAEGQAPDSLIINLAAGTIEYFSAIVPSAVPRTLPAWPEPVPWAFVLRSDEALAWLERAASRFKKALDLSDLSLEERHCIEAWYIACLASSPDREDLAQGELQRRLGQNVVNHRLIVWAAARFPDLKIDRSVLALRNAILDQPGSCEQVAALVYRYAAKQQWKKAWNLLIAKRSIFADSNTDAVWRFWAAQLKIAMGRFEAADQSLLVDHLPERERRILETKLLDRHHTSGGTEKLIEHLEQSFTATGDPHFLLMAVELKAQHGDWSYVAQRAHSLFAALPTAEVLNLCVTGAFHARQFQLCVDMLTTNAGMFPASKLPAELRRIRVNCQHALGSTSEAIREAEALAAENPSLESLYALTQLYFAVGDYRHHAIAAERLASLEQVRPQFLLRLSWQVQWEDRGLAIRLWNSAVRAGIPDDEVIPALEIGYALGQDDHLKRLTERMTRLGSQGREGIRMASIDDIKGYATEFYSRAEKFVETYDRGQVPIHMIAAPLNIALAEVYHKQLSESYESPFTCWQPCVWARHASRPVPQLQPQSATSECLTIDVTSLLLAQHFGYLDDVETSFRPIRISPGLIPSLVLMQDRLTANQPQRIQACATLRKCVEARQITIVEPDDSAQTGLSYPSPNWLAFAKKAVETESFIVDFLPLMGEDGNLVTPDSVTESIRTKLIGPRAILDALLEHGPLSQSEYSILRERLGSVAANAGEAVPRHGDALYFAGTCIEALAGVGILPTTIDRFRVHVMRREVDQVENTLICSQQRTELANWVKDLIGRLSVGIRNGTYALLPEIVNEQESAGDIQNENADLAALFPILKVSAKDHERLWADDRWLNGHTRVGNLDPIDSVEVLGSLVRSEKMTRERFFELVGKMRAAGVHFIPISAQEIVATLDSGRVVDLKLVETQRLINLRRGVAGSLLRSRVLQRPDPSYAGTEFGELTFLIQHVRACIEALCLLWDDPKLNVEDRAAKAHWLMEALYVDQHAVRRMAGLSANDADDRYALALTFASVLARAVTTFSPKTADWKGREFVAWAFARLIRRRAEFDPSLLETTSEYVKNLLRDLVPKDSTRRASQAMILVIQHVVRNLPRELNEQIGRDSDFMTAIGLKTIAVAELGKICFEKSEFTLAVAEAINGQTGKAKIINSDLCVTFTGVESRPSTVQAELPTGERYVLSDPLLGLLTNSVVEREGVAIRLRRLFDLGAGQVSATVAELASTDDLELRLQKAEQLRGQSLVSFYENLITKLREGGGIAESDLFPNKPECLLRHLRLRPDGNYAEDGAAVLAEELSEQSTSDDLLMILIRLFSLPCPLPESVTGVLSRVDFAGRRRIIKTLLRSTTSPLQRLHLAHVLFQVFGDGQVFRRLGGYVIRKLIRDYSCFEPYIAFIRWSFGRVRSSNRTDAWKVTQELAAAWLHGDRIFGILRAHGYDVSEVAEHLAVSPARLQNVFAAPHPCVDDVAHPDNIDPEVMLLCGLNYAVGEADWDDANLRMHLSEALTIKHGEQIFPALGLIPSTATASDRLTSFFAGDRLALLKRWVSAENYTSVTGAFQGFGGEQIIAELKRGICDMWMSLSAVVGQFPVRSELVPEIEKAILSCDFGARAIDDPRIACTTLLIAASVLRFIPADCVARHLENQIVSVARTLGARDKLGPTRQLGFAVIESSVKVARTAAELSSRIDKFASIIARAVAAWPGLVDVIRPYIQRLCEELPLAQNAELWRLNCQLRSSR